MSTQILRPEGTGVETNIAGQYPTSGEHWDKVDEATPDDASTYVRHNLTSYATDTYAIPAGEGVGDIDKVTVYARCYGVSGNYNYAKTVIRTHSTLYEGNEHNLTSSWENLSTEYSTNPNTGQAWTWAEIDVLEAGVALKSSSSGDFFAICTQVYVEVTYHTETPKSSSDAGSGADSSQAHVSITGADTGSGQGASGQAASLVGQESGSSTEGLSFLANLLGNELGSALEKLGDRQIVLDESNEGMEASSLGAALVVGDSGSGIGATESRGLVSGEIGAGISLSGLFCQMVKLDSSVGAETAELLVAIAGCDSGVGIGATDLLATLLVVAEAGSGADQLLAKVLAASQAGSGLDNISDLWKGTEDKDMQRSDSGGGAEAVHDRVIFLPDSGAAIDTLLSRSLFAREGYGHALSFGGIDDFVDFGNIFNSFVTLELWFKAGAFPTKWTGVLINKWGTGGDRWAIGVRTDSDRVAIHVTDSGWHTIHTTDLTNWHYIAIVYDSGTFKLYYDGVYQSGNDFVNSFGAGNANPLRMGIWSNSLTGDYTGLIDQVRFSDVCRTQAEITANWNGGAGRRFEKDEHTVALWHMDEGTGSTIYDETDNNNDGTIYGASWVDGFKLSNAIETPSLLSALTRAEVGSGAESLLARLLATSEAGAGVEALLSRLLHHADSGLGADARTALSALRLAQETGSGLDALIGLYAWRLAHETGLGVDKLLGRGIPLFDVGSGVDAATLFKAFLSADGGYGLEVVAALLTRIITNEVGSGSERLRAKIESATKGGGMKLSPEGRRISIPSRKVNI